MAMINRHFTLDPLPAFVHADGLGVIVEAVSMMIKTWILARTRDKMALEKEQNDADSGWRENVNLTKRR